MIMRDWYMGCAPAFQAVETSSSLVSRSIQGLNIMLKQLLKVLAAFIITFIIMSIVLSARADEPEGPQYPAYDLWTGCCERTSLSFSDIRNERERTTRTDRQDVRTDLVDRLLRDAPSMCLMSPVPIDDYYLGCVVRFNVDPVTVEEWE